MTWFTLCSWPLEGGTTGNSWLGCATWFSKSWPYFRPKMSFSTHPFSDRISKIHAHFQTWPNLARSRLLDSGRDSPVCSRFIFVFALSQFSGPSYLGAWNRLGLIRQKLCHHYQIRAQKKNFSNTFRIRIFLFRLYSFGTETINSFIHVRSRSFLENYTRFQTKMGKAFSDQKGPKTLPFGATYMAYIREYPPPSPLPGPDPFHDC